MRPLPPSKRGSCQPFTQQDDQRIMPGRDFESTLSEQRCGVAACEPEFSQPLCRDETQQNNRRRHAALFSETQLAVKPGPIAVSSVRGGKPA
jgi:hypothetical protein